MVLKFTFCIYFSLPTLHFGCKRLPRVKFRCWEKWHLAIGTIIFRCVTTNLENFKRLFYHVLNTWIIAHTLAFYGCCSACLFCRLLFVFVLFRAAFFPAQSSLRVLTLNPFPWQIFSILEHRKFGQTTTANQITHLYSASSERAAKNIWNLSVENCIYLFFRSPNIVDMIWTLKPYSMLLNCTPRTS